MIVKGLSIFGAITVATFNEHFIASDLYFLFFGISFILACVMTGDKNV